MKLFSKFCIIQVTDVAKQYGSGLRLMESVRLRVKDLDFDHLAVLVRDGKGGKDRVVTLPDELVKPLARHLENRKTMFERDLEQGVAAVHLPYALERKYPNANQEWGWQYVFPARRPSRDPRSRTHPPSSHRGDRSTTRCQAGHSNGWDPPARSLPYVAAFVCHESARARHGHTHRPGAARS